MNLPAHHKQIVDMLNGFDQGKSIKEVLNNVFPDYAGPIGSMDQLQWVQEVFNNRAWYEERLLVIFPGIRRRVYTEECTFN
jgi:hypothetical protein